MLPLLIQVLSMEIEAHLKTDLNPKPNHILFRGRFYVLRVLCIAYALLCNIVIYCHIQYRTCQVSNAPAQESSMRFKSIISYYLLCRSNYMSPTLKAFPLQNGNGFQISCMVFDIWTQCWAQKHNDVLMQIYLYLFVLANNSGQ